MKKILFALAAVLVLSVPAFADVTNDNYFAALPFIVNSRVANYSVSAASGTPYCFIQGTHCYAISESSGSIHVSGTDQNGDTVNNDQNLSTGFGNTSYYFVYFGEVSSGGFTSSPTINAVPDGYSRNDIGSAFADFLANPPAPALASTFTVPSGNVLYFKVDREQDVTFTAVMPVMSSLLGTPTGAWNSGIQYGPAAALPTSGTTFPILSQDPINFAKTVSNQNLLGQTKNAISTKHCIVGQYYALYLPYHYGGWLALGSSHVYPDGSTSGGIVGANVTVSGSFAEIKVYPLTEKANGDLLTGSVTLDSGSDDGFASYFDGEISETGTVTWLDQNGDISSPSVGGTSYVPEDVSTESIIDQIKNILSSIVSEIKNLFSFGYEAVNTLVGLMHDFVGVFKQLYEWLPTEVYSALVSAIIVAITIGVFKVFL